MKVFFPEKSKLKMLEEDVKAKENSIIVSDSCQVA